MYQSFQISLNSEVMQSKLKLFLSYFIPKNISEGNCYKRLTQLIFTKNRQPSIIIDLTSIFVEMLVLVHNFVWKIYLKSLHFFIFPSHYARVKECFCYAESIPLWKTFHEIYTIYSLNGQMKAEYSKK